MSIVSAKNTPRNSYTATSSQTAFTIGFEFFAVADVKVYKNGTLMTYNASPSNNVTYKITGTASSSDSAYEFGAGGTVTFGAGLAADDIVVIVRDITVERTTDFTPSGSFDISTLNTQLDTIISMVADTQQQTDRSVKLLDTDTVSATVTLPAKATRASKVASFDSDGNLETTITSTGLSAINDVTTEIGLLGTSANVTAMGLLGTSAVVADMALLGTSAVVADMALLADSDVIADMAILATSDIVSDLNTLATSDIVSDINVLATSDIVSDLNTLATSAIVTDLSILATSDIVSDINVLATSDIVSDLNTLATSDFVSDLNTLASSTVVANIATVASNVAGVNSFAERYRVGSSDPSSDNDAGDLAFNTTSNTLKFFDGSSYNAIATTFSIDAASDTNLSSPADGALLLYDTGTSKFIDNVVSGDATLADTGALTIANDAITGAKIADDAINSEHYTDGSIDTAHIADSQITNAKMADDSVGSAELVDNSVGAAALNISGNGTTGQVIVSDGDGSFSYADTSNPFSPTTASGTSPTLSLATHNFFDLGQLSGNTTLAFSNIPTAKRWFVDVQGNGSQSNFASGTRVGQSSNYTGASYANLRGTNGVCYKPDGSVVFICGGLNTSTFKQHIKSYALSTAFDPSSISLSDSPTKVFDLSSQVYSASQGDQYVTGLDMRSDGTMFYINHYDPAGGANNISQYTMSTPFDVSSASHTATKALYGSGGNGKTRGLHLRQNGADIYFANDTDNRIERWTMSTPYSISTASSTSTFDISGTTTTPNNVVLTEDGTKMIVTANLFTLSSAFDITSAGSPSSLGDIIDGHLGDMSITNSDKHLSQITLGASAVTSTGVTIYSTAFITPFTLTMPAAVKNSDYLPDVNVDDQYLLEFNTTDGGTNIWKTAHVKYDDN
jgi:hypothetical protein